MIPMLIILGSVAAFTAYHQGQIRGYVKGKALSEPLVVALENQVQEYGKLIDALKNQVAAQDEQIVAQDRLIEVLGASTTER